MERSLFQKYFALIVIILMIGMSNTYIAVSNKISYPNILYTPHDPIYIDGNDNFTSENGVTGGSGTYSDPYIIEDWEIDASSKHGIKIRNTDVYFVIDNCYFHSGGTIRDGIVFKNVTKGEIKDSIIEDNRYGIIFRTQDYPLQENSSHNTIKNNTIIDNARDGIHFEHTMTGHHSYNLIFLNEISGNDQGIYMVMSAYNEIFSNNIIFNTRWGVNLTTCMGGGENNRVYHNNFIENGDENGQACAWWTLDNDWDDGYPSGGNFWSDYYGVDNFSGPNQNIPGSDGIGDTPYDIFLFWDYYEGDFKPSEYDYYPLMEPWGENLHPFAEFSWTPAHPDPGEEVLFNASESIDYDGNITLYEWDWDNDGVFDENHTSPTATHTFEEVGYYPVTLRVTDNDNLTDSKTKTVRVGNYPPCMPSNPNPHDGATNVSIVVDLSWIGGDPDGDPVTFDVYFGNTTPPPKVASNVTEYNPGLLDFNTTYYWKIVAWDNYGASAAGPIWSFTTRGNQTPDPPMIDGRTKGKVGTGYQYNFSLSDSDDDAMYLRVDWGSGTPGPWTGPYDSDTTVRLNHTWNEKGTYTIRAQAKDIYNVEGEWGTLTVTMPKNKMAYSSLLFRLLERLSQSFHFFFIILLKFNHIL